jgi:hypothetical protein
VSDRRARLLQAALGFGALPRPSYDRALWALRTWLDSWSGTGPAALSEDGVVLTGQRRESGRVFPVALTLIRRGRTLEGAVLGPDNRVYIFVVTRPQ